MNDLVERLSEDQPIEASLRPEKDATALQEAIDRGYVHILFPGTRGGTELGVPLDEEATDTSGADFAAGTGSVHLEGNLELDYVKVRFRGDIELSDLAGSGKLSPTESSHPASP